MADPQWKNSLIDWRQPKVWMPILEQWLEPILSEDATAKLQSIECQEFYVDDSIWLDEFAQSILEKPVKVVLDELALSIKCAFVKGYHGCCVDDASSYHENGIKLNSPSELAKEALSLLKIHPELKCLALSLEEKMNDPKFRNRDAGKLYLCLDDRNLINEAGHYLLYGSEWVQSALGWEAHEILRTSGVPTIIIVKLPLAELHHNEVFELAKSLLHEWTRLKAECTFKPMLVDFSFELRKVVPSSWVLSHYHPAEVIDPFYGNIRRETKDKFCRACIR